MARDELDGARTGAIGVLLFCECMRQGECGQASRIVGWYVGEYDTLSSEEVYVAVAGHRRLCGLQPDLIADALEQSQ